VNLHAELDAPVRALRPRLVYVCQEEIYAQIETRATPSRVTQAERSRARTLSEQRAE
jgi:hypothetical protein